MAGMLMTDPGFARGQTLGVSDPVQGTSVTGTQKTFTDVDPRTTHAGMFYSNRTVTCLAVRNTSGAPLLPGTVVEMKKTAILDEVEGPSAAGEGLVGVVDEYLPVKGVENNDVFWLVVSGPVAITTAGAMAPGDEVGVAGGEAVAGTGFGYCITEPKDGKVRCLVGAVSEHSAV